ncbi:extracellular solute-binding protein [Conexibacter sp. JD483]|uniref:extracellular solute-binding protein n=1 Tax=unclassified Conexibacter TaxID=2627773 RepID=UPI0027239B37|nr:MULTISPECIES: extracellular solute-binding protein [unclassified Conexibacter]MDO8188331.1 extracellular solute-binding protein [Conexibacter sp. CPCC 205706]MDO8200721.1 extracellular solute-binding protein [Conexibacter sp. CPCC 205762]MDR9369445.1 extracellular solute-binding protein [Conexibacter sp. JD483]
MSALETTRRGLATGLALAAAATTLAACGGTPGESKPPAASTTEAVSTTITRDDVALTILDTGVDPGPDAEYKALIEQFERQHPNVTVRRTVQPFSSLLSSIKLRLSSDEAPDVSEGNPGPQVDGALVRGGLIRPLTGWAAPSAYGWDAIWPAATQATNMYGDDGVVFGSGTLWGISPRGELVGLFYNKAKLAELGFDPPRTVAELDTILAAAKRAGETPLMIGEQDRYPGGHALMALANAYADPASLRDWVFGRAGATVDDAGMVAAAGKLRDWAEAGYFQNGFLGVKDAEAQARFASGQAVFMIGVSILNGGLADGLDDDLGFVAMPSARAGAEVYATGSLSPGMHVSSRSEHPDVAAAWLNLLASEEGAETILAHGDVPAYPVRDPRVEPGSSLESIVKTWGEQSTGGRLVPYLDSATTTMYDTLTGGVQQLMAGSMSPEAFAESIQDDWTRAHGSGK